MTIISAEDLERRVLAAEQNRALAPGLVIVGDATEEATPDPETPDVDAVIRHHRVFGRPAEKNDLDELFLKGMEYRAQRKAIQTRIREDLEEIDRLTTLANDTDTAHQNVMIQLQRQAAEE